MPRDPVAELRALPAVQDRVDAIAADLNRPRRQRRFTAVDPWVLAEELFDLQLDGPDHGYFVKAYARKTLEDSDDEFPARARLAVLKDRVSARRYAVLCTQAQRIDDGLRDQDLRLTAREQRLVEASMNDDDEDDRPLYQVNHYELTATDGTAVCFRVIQGDAGELEALTGPYDIHDGKCEDDPNVRHGGAF
jgi:hypothetical protein